MGVDDGGAARHARAGAARAMPRAAGPRARHCRAPCTSTSRSGWAGTPRRCSSGIRTWSSSDSTGTPRRSSTPGTGWLGSRRVSIWFTRSTTSFRGCSPSSDTTGSTVGCSTWVCPRCSWTRRTAASRTRRTRRWTCGWTRAAGITAEEVVNTYEPGDLVRILRQYGEEKFAPRVVSAIVRERSTGRITSTARLAELVKDAIPAAARRTGGNPAKRTFQALRIEVNGELAALESALPAALDALAPKGRLVVMSYQSLEDRIVKRELTARSRSTGPIDLPVELPGTGPTLRLLTRGSEPPSDDEVAANPRAASVKLRAVERIDEQDQARRQPGPPANGPGCATQGGRRAATPGRAPGGGGESMSERIYAPRSGGRTVESRSAATPRRVERPDPGSGREPGSRRVTPGGRVTPPTTRDVPGSGVTSATLSPSGVVVRTRPWTGPPHCGPTRR